MARTFYWQFDQSIEDTCKHEAAIVQAVITAVEMAAIAVRTFWSHCYPSWSIIWAERYFE